MYLNLIFVLKTYVVLKQKIFIYIDLNFDCFFICNIAIFIHKKCNIINYNNSTEG